MMCGGGEGKCHVHGQVSVMAGPGTPDCALHKCFFFLVFFL